MSLTKWSNSDRAALDMEWSYEQIIRFSDQEMIEFVGDEIFIKVNNYENQLMRLLSSSDWQYWDYFYQGMIAFISNKNGIVAIGSGKGGVFALEEKGGNLIIRQYNGVKISINNNLFAENINKIIYEISTALSRLLKIEITGDPVSDCNEICKKGRRLISRR